MDETKTKQKNLFPFPISVETACYNALSDFKKSQT